MVTKVLVEFNEKNTEIPVIVIEDFMSTNPDKDIYILLSKWASKLIKLEAANVIVTTKNSLATRILENCNFKFIF